VARDVAVVWHGFTQMAAYATNTPVIDYTSAGNTTWGGCREEGISTGINFKF